MRHVRFCVFVALPTFSFSFLTLVFLWRWSTPNYSQEYQPFPNVQSKNAAQASLEVPVLVSLLDIPRQKRVLEVGTGRGIALPGLWERLQPQRLVGIDIDDSILLEANETLKKNRLGDKIEVVKGDVRNLPFKNQTFDVVIDFGTLYHIANPQQALQEIRRVLVPNGIFIEETEFSEFVSHPIRSWARKIPWDTIPCFVLKNHVLQYQLLENHCM